VSNSRAAHAPPRTRAVLLLLGALAASAGAHAVPLYEQAGLSLEFFGILDIGLGYLEHSYASSEVLASSVNPYNLNSSPNSFAGLYSGGLSMSRLGLRGAADLGAGRKAFFRLETALTLTSGELSNNGQAIYNNLHGNSSANSASAINGQWASRAAYAGVSDPLWGSLELGRTLNFALDQVVEYDPLQAALLYSPLGYSGGIGGGLGATENTRLNNSVRYEDQLHGIAFGVQYKFAGDKGSESAGSGWVAKLSYAHGALAVAGTFSEMTNTVTWPVQYSNVVPPDANVQVENTKGYLLSARYQLLPGAAVKAGYEQLDVWAPSNRNLNVQDYFGILLPHPSVNASGQQHLELWWLGGDYHFTPACYVDVGFYDIDTFNEPESGKQYLGTAYSVLADYGFTPRFDTYAGIMALHYSGPGLTRHAPENAYANNAMYGVGLRFRF